MLVVGGIYTGAFTPTEAAAIGTVYSLFITFVIYRTLGLEGYAGNFAGYSQNDFDDFRDYDRRNFIWFRFNYSAGSAGFDEPGCRKWKPAGG